MDSHPDKDWRRVLFKCLAKFQCASHGRFRAIAKNQRHPIARCDPQQFVFLAGQADLLRSLHKLIQSANHSRLVVNEQFRISHHVDEQDVPDSESGGQVRWHTEALADSDARRFPLQELVQFHNLSSRLIATDVGS